MIAESSLIGALPAAASRAVRPLRIAMVAACPLPARRGTPLRVERLAGALAARGHDVELVTYHLVEDMHPLPMRVHRILPARERRLPPGPTFAKLALYDPLLAHRLARLLAARPFDLVYAHHYEGLLVALVARPRASLPIVYDAHTMLGSELPVYGPLASRGLTARFGSWLDGRLPRLADHIVAVTPDIRTRLICEHGLAPGRVSVVMNGVEAARFADCPEPDAPAATRIIYSGTIAPYQDLDLLLRAFAVARTRVPALRLTLSVSASFDAYRGLVRELGIADAIEVLADDFDLLPARLSACAIAALPRMRCDGIPQKLLNYMAAARAVVASAGSAKVIDHGRTGLVVPNGDVEAFAAALVGLATDPAHCIALGRAARLHVQRSCSWERAAEGAERICSTLAALAALGKSRNVMRWRH